MKNSQSNKKSILDLSHEDARNFLLSSENYCSLNLPSYIKFDTLLNAVRTIVEGNSIQPNESKKARKYYDVNYTMINNKDGKYAWRPFQLIHPHLYVSLVNQLTQEESWRDILKRFKKFQKNNNICCLSLPIIPQENKKQAEAQVSHWWYEVEQHSLELSLEYQCLLETDITDCYGAIYTHSIAWALHGKDVAKNNRTNKNFIGNKIDAYIQDMRHGQTNGIPQGSTLMDFIAEMVLGYLDLQLSEKISESNKIKNYKILRYRDDYRVFVNNLQDGEEIIKLLSKMATDLGLRLNPQKTKSSSDIVTSSIKRDKLAWLVKNNFNKNFQKQLLIIHEHSVQFPNAGSLIVALSKCYKQLLKIKNLGDPMPLISIVVDIAYHNTRTYPICAAILSCLLDRLQKAKEKNDVLDKIISKLQSIPNTGFLEIWLQRISLPINKEKKYDEPICQLVSGKKDTTIWNLEWIKDDELKEALNPNKIFDEAEAKKNKSIIPLEEVTLFNTTY